MTPFVFRASAALFLPLIVATLPCRSDAETVTVTARTTLWAEISEETGTLHGWLADDLGERLANERVVVRAEGVERSVVTDRRGEFALALPAGSRAQTVTLEYSGDTFHEAATLVREVDPSRLPLALQLIVPPRVELGTGTIEIQVRAERDDRPAVVPFTVVRPETGDVLASGRTDETGWASLSFDPRALGAPGRHQLHARFAGDRDLAPALARAETMLVDTTTITLRASDETVLPDQAVRLHGRLVGTFSPLPGREVALVADGRALTSVTTLEGGFFDARLRGETLAEEGPIELIARFDSLSTARASSESRPVRIVVSRPRPLAVGAIAAPALATIALVIAVLLLTRRRSREDELERPRASMLPVAAGLRPSNVTQRARRRVEAFDLDGEVWDPVEDRPVGGATVTIETSAGSIRRTTAADGSFRFAPMDPGDHQVTVARAGYVPEVFRVTLPHTGQLHGVRVDVVQVRHRALEVYRGAARPLLPRLSLWGRWTPREVAVHAAGAYPWISDELAELTSFFETLYYSPSAGAVEDLARVEQLAEALARSRGRGAREALSDG